MKKILIAMTMFAATIGNANAFEFNTNGDVLVQMIIKEVVLQTVGNTAKNDSGTVIVDTVGIQTQGKVSQCWTSPQYFSDGSMKMRVRCH